MKKQLLIIAMLILPFAVSAQISLNATLAPPVNSIMTFYDANVPFPAFTFSTSGINNTWDFSSIQSFPGTEDTTYIADPSAIPLAAQFPSATHCIYSDGTDQDISVINITNSAFTYIGLITNPFGPYIGLPITPPAVKMNFPYTYPQSDNITTGLNLAATGAQIGQPTLDSARRSATIIVQADVVAAGNMIIPSGTFPCLLVREIKTEYDTIRIKGASTGGMWVVASTEQTIDSSFYWYSNQSLIPYAHALYDDTGLHDVHFFKAMTTNVNDKAQDLSFDVYPNPAADVLRLKGIVNGLTYNVTIFNVAGQIAMQGTTSTNQLDIYLLPKGVYTVQLSNASGFSVSKKFVKE